MIERSRLGPRDLISEAVSGVLQRPGRSTLTVLGTVLGIGAFVAILGLTATAGGQIDKRFTAMAATTVAVEDIAEPESGIREMGFPNDATARVARIDGVVTGGVFWQLTLQDLHITGAPDLPSDGSGLNLYAADPGALAAIHPAMQSGRLFDDFHQSRSERVAVISKIAADRMGIRRLDAHPAIFISGTPYTVVGVFNDVVRQPELLLGIIIPTSTAFKLYGPPVTQPARMIIETRLGAARVVADQVAVALRPDVPHRLKVSALADPQSLRGNITGDLSTLLILLAAISLVVGAIGIANTTFVSVLERTAEIGLRRALGARPRHIAAQFLTESATLGSLGGLVGTSLGVAIVVFVAIAHDWSAVLYPWTVFSAPLAGTAVGLAAGLYPAMSAARIEPVEALRR